MRIAGSGDPAAGFASDFLGGVMGDAVQTKVQSGSVKPPADPLGEFIANNEQAWADRQANYEQVLAAFNTPPNVDRSDDILLAAGPGYSLDAGGPGRINGGNAIRPSQGFGADLMGIVNSDLPWTDKVQMTRDTIAYYYRNSPAFQGWVQSAGGGAEMLGGMALSGVPGGIVPGSAAILHGADNFVTGLRRNDGYTGGTGTYELVNAATGSPWLADAVDRGIPFVGGVVTPGAMLNGVDAVNGLTSTRVIAQYGPMSKPGPLPQAIANTFRSSTYTEVVTTEPISLYRVYGGTANQLGGYWTTMPPAGPVQSIIDSALNPVWGNTATRVVRIEVPSGVRLYQGQAANQGGLVGGGSQVLFSRDVTIDASWIKK